MEEKMLHFYLVDQAALPLIEALAAALLRLIGGPARLPQRNDDLVWY